MVPEANQNEADAGCIWCVSGADVTKDTTIIMIQIPLKIHFVIIPILAIRLLQIFGHATTAQLSWHVQNCVVINWLKFEWEQD